VSIVEKVQELRDMLREQFGVCATVNISVYDTFNPIITKELANYISFELASEVAPDSIYSYLNHSSNGYHWVELDVNGFRFTAFYPEGVVEHAGEHEPVCPGAA